MERVGLEIPPLFPGNPGFLVQGMLAAPFAEFLVLQLALHGFLVFSRIVIPPLARCAAQSY